MTPSAYRAFWTRVGDRFPDLAGAASTRYYSDNERRLFTEHFPALKGLKILKTDLWDEAKNTRILAWASRQGAQAYGVDISEPTVIQARGAFDAGHGALRSAVGDVRALPFHDDSFDAIYSMGTIEHFDQTEDAVGEIARVLKPGGRAIIGVPNRHDPFLRPLFVTALQALGIYGYGYEKSYSRHALRQMLERAGLDVLAETAILFMPGWLRMLDLACHSWCRPLAAVTGALVRPFVWFDRHIPAVRRHGYLLATIVTKPERAAGNNRGHRTRSPDPDGMSVAIAILWAGYLLVLPFQRVWVLPWLGLKFQPPEVVFLGLVTASAALWMRERVSWRFALADAAAAAWLAANLLAFAWSSGRYGRDGLIQTLGAAYVVSLYLVVRVTATPQLLDRFGQWFSYSAAVAAALGIAGSLASLAGLPNRLATIVALTPVPYLGNAARAHAFTAGPQMLASILLMAIPLFVAGRMQHGWRRRDRALVLLLVLGLVATVSKTALCLAAALSVMWAFAARTRQQPQSRRSRARLWVAVGIWVVVTLGFTLGSHVMVLREAAVPSSSAAQLVGGSPLASFRWGDEAWVAMPTTYLFNKQASLRAIGRSWPTGVGPAGQPEFTLGLQREGRFPRTIWLITPHSTYLGTVAELGAAGLAALLLILIAGAMTIKRLLAASARLRWEAAACAGVGAAFLIEAISTDLLNCRHYWFFLAVLAARLDAEALGIADRVRG